MPSEPGMSESIPTNLAPDVKLGFRFIMCLGIFATEEIADYRCRKPLIGNHSVLNRVTDIDQVYVTSHDLNLPESSKEKPIARFAHPHTLPYH